MRLVRMAFFVLLSSLPSFAQGPAPRLTGPISENKRVVLPHSRTPRVLAGQDLGPVAPDMPIPGITLVFRRSAAQEAALQELLAALQTPGSPQYHQWLTPEVFATRFGIADSDIATTSSWLSSHGFQVETVARSRDRITFTGSAAQVEAAFGAALHHYKVDGEVHFAPASDLSLPAELARMVGAVLHLSDFRPKPSWKVPANAGRNYTAYPSGDHYLTPRDLAIMYQISTPSVPNGIGDGQMAVAGQSYVNTGNPSALNDFGIPAAFPVLVPGSGVEAVALGDEAESEIDLEYASTFSQTNVFFVFVGASQNYSVFDSIAYAITENIAPVVSVSYGSCEPLVSMTELDESNALYEEAAAQGQTLVASSGDSGSTSCAPFTVADGVTVLQQQELAVNFPASSPYFTAVGGTQMAAGTFAAGNTTYWADNFSISPAASLLSYVPEVAWNEGSVARGILAGGGGPSTLFPRPAWQTSFPGMPTGNYRMLPDVSLQASVDSPGYIICTDDPSLYRAEGQTSSCGNGLQGNGNTVTVAGGTSFAAPIFAGYVAFLNQVEGASGQGNLNPVLYGLAANAATYAAAFHDITSGGIGCVAGAANCTPSAETAYAAGPGYDLATGLGSMNLGALQMAWPAAAPGLQVPFVLVNPTASSTAAGQSLPVQISVSGNSGPNPTGSVSVSVDGAVVDAALALTQGQYSALVTYNFIGPSIPGGHVITVRYLGDTVYTTATATGSVIVGDVLASGGMTLSAANLTITNGSKGTTTVTITPTGGYDGSVTWSLGITGVSTTSITGCYQIAPVTVSSVTTAQLTIGTGAACSAATANSKGVFRIVGSHAAAIGDTPAGPGHSPVTLVYASLLFGGCLAWRRRKGSVAWLLLIFLLPIAGASLGGCGGGGNSASTPPPVNPASTFTATLTGTDSVNGLVTATANFTLTVNGQ